MMPSKRQLVIKIADINERGGKLHVRNTILTQRKKKKKHTFSEIKCLNALFSYVSVRYLTTTNTPLRNSLVPP